MNLEGAVAFIQEYGSAVEHARLAFLMHATPPEPYVVVQLIAQQHADGGWAPFWAPTYSALDATCYRLAQAEALGLVPGAPELQHACHFLIARQRADGSWDETPPPGLTLPPWISPGTEETICYLTANCGFWLTRFPATNRAVARAASFLQTATQAQGYLPGPVHTTWLALAIWHSTGAVHEVAAARNHLTQQLPNLSASNLAWALATLAGLETTDVLMVTMKQRLDELQQPDGRWVSDDGPEGDVHTTLEALRVLLKG